MQPGGQAPSGKQRTQSTRGQAAAPGLVSVAGRRACPCGRQGGWRGQGRVEEAGQGALAHCVASGSRVVNESSRGGLSRTAEHASRGARRGHGSSLAGHARAGVSVQGKGGVRGGKRGRAGQANKRDWRGETSRASVEEFICQQEGIKGVVAKHGRQQLVHPALSGEQAGRGAAASGAGRTQQLRQQPQPYTGI